MIEPGDEAADLGPVDRVHAQKPRFRPGLLEIFADHAAVDDHPVAVEQHWDLGRRIERRQLLRAGARARRLQLVSSSFSRSRTRTLRENGPSGKWSRRSMDIT